MQAGAAALATGKLITNDGDGRTSYVARADLALAAAAVLTTDGHDGKAYDLTGPEALGATDLAALAAEAGGRPVEPVFLGDDAWVAAMVEHAGMPEPVAKRTRRSASPRGRATWGSSARRWRSSSAGR